MAKKGAVQQLQADLQNDEDFAKFLERPGLLVLDVYSDWCGPCLGMVGSLRRVKLEYGGDNLQLAICKSDTITDLKRFNKRSEPTWLFVTGGKAVNIMYGTDAPKLLAVVLKELEKTLQKLPRTHLYDIAELQPIEVEQLRVKTEAIEKLERIERDAKNKKQNDYLNQVTDAIMENMPDIGITVFGPQVNRDMFKKLTEPAEPLKMQCKDRKVVQVTTEQFDIVNYACRNPMPPDVLKQLDGKELLMCFWKIDETVGTVPNVLAAYAHELTRERSAPPNDQFFEEHAIPPIISPMKIKFEVELKEGEVWVEDVSSEEEQKPVKGKKHPKLKSPTHQEDATPVAVDEEVAEQDGEEEGSEEDGPEYGADGLPSLPSMPFDIDLDLDLGDDMGEEEEEVKEEEPPKPLTRTKTVKMPAVWVPNNRRTHAALIYMFFRGQTTGFLPPDPKPEPPHIIMAFDATKRREIMHVVERHREEVPLYGYFTNDDPDGTELIANSTDKYDYYPEQLLSDKIVLKVNKVQSNMMLSLVSYGPSYVSPNVTAGHDEALKFFPEDYKQQEEPPADVKQKKVKKGKKSEEIPEKAREKAASLEPQRTTVPADAGAGVSTDVQPPGKDIEKETSLIAEGEAAVPPTTEGEGVPAPEGESVVAEVTHESAPSDTAAAEVPQPGEAVAETSAPPESAPPEVAPEPPKEETPPVEAPPTEAPQPEPTPPEAPPTEDPPTEAPPAEEPPTEAPPPEAPPPDAE
ncbi:LOW QUALITY PROTEIN: thioredoxin domain-containing protein 3 homolog [Drosophila tropicalis]|uniref:LOW QUALITY PROTEIN: thioredoxin domain-containing protein 3 homolog n=1 Tax=Drosophila tropicalis TaxID=46794 RepID=UPI0035AC037C